MLLGAALFYAPVAPSVQDPHSARELAAAAAGCLLSVAGFVMLYYVRSGRGRTNERRRSFLFTVALCSHAASVLLLLYAFSARGYGA